MKTKASVILAALSVLLSVTVFSGCVKSEDAVGTAMNIPIKTGYGMYESLASDLNAKADKYKKELESKLKKSSEKKSIVKREMSENFYGLLYDFDNNGTKELLTYSYNNKTEDPENLYSIYTIKNNQLKTVVKNRKNYISYVGNERGCVGIASKNGKNYLFEVKSNAPTDFSEVRRTYNYTVYNITGGGLKKLNTAKWVEVNSAIGKKYHKEYPKAYTKSQYKIDGKKVDKTKFMNFINSFKLKNLKKEKAVEKDGYYITSSASAPDKLLKQVKKI